MICCITGTKFAWFLLLLTLASGPGADGSIYTIDDDRVRSLDISPTLGRGYSIMTNQYHSTCLMVSETTVPSYNYDYFFREFKSAAEGSSSFAMAASGGGSGIIGPVQVSGGFAAFGSMSSKFKMSTHMIIATMKIDRYYSSVKEEVTPLSPDAKTLLETQDYVGFFNACGPNYIRSIRRAQEVSAMFTFQTSTRESASQFGAAMRMSARTMGATVRASASMYAASKFSAQNSSMKIRIFGYGMGLTSQGSETMVATTLTEYNNVMQYAFNSMTRNSDAHHIGQVLGMEVVPWVANTAFQVAAKLGDETITVPMERSLIPRAQSIVGVNLAWDGTSVSTRSNFKCKNGSFAMDKYGYCCDPSQLYDPIAELYTGLDAAATVSTAGQTLTTALVCKPVRNLDPTLVKENMTNNGEFVSRLASTMRYKLVQLSQLEKCISAAHSIPTLMQYSYLKPLDSVKQDGVINVKITVAELKLSLDPGNDYGIMKQLGRDLDEWIQMFYSPCYAALYGTNVGTTPETDISYFMAFPWYSHPECMKLSCLTATMRWNREDPGGCVPSVVLGADQVTDLPTAAATNCVKDESNYNSDVCKYDLAATNDYVRTQKACVAFNPSPTLNPDMFVGSIDYFLNNYCLPQMTFDEAPFLADITLSIISPQIPNIPLATVTREQIDARVTACTMPTFP